MSHRQAQAKGGHSSKPPKPRKEHKSQSASNAGLQKTDNGSRVSTTSKDSSILDHFHSMATRSRSASVTSSEAVGDVTLNESDRPVQLESSQLFDPEGESSQSGAITARVLLQAIHANGANISNLKDTVEKLCATVITLQTENDKMKKELEERKKNEKELHAELVSVRHRAELADEKANFLEQYGRNYNIRIFHLDEPENETQEECEDTVLKLLHTKLGLMHVKKSDFDAVHRLGQKKENNTRGVIVRFISRKIRSEVLSNRRKLKQSGRLGKSVVITEDLTKRNYQLFCFARDSDVAERAWSTQGKILIKAKNGKIKHIRQKSDLEDPTLRSKSPPPPRRSGTGNTVAVTQSRNNSNEGNKVQLKVKQVNEETETDNEISEDCESETEREQGLSPADTWG